MVGAFLGSICTAFEVFWVAGVAAGTSAFDCGLAPSVGPPSCSPPAVMARTPSLTPGGPSTRSPSPLFTANAFALAVRSNTKP
uniref:Putative secreted protein n=1 Tax=Anopheles darlingi TaxID=43151 RepID=A0A2M4DM96_ANODA